MLPKTRHVTCKSDQSNDIGSSIGWYYVGHLQAFPKPAMWSTFSSVLDTDKWWQRLLNLFILESEKSLKFYNFFPARTASESFYQVSREKEKAEESAARVSSPNPGQ